MPDSASNKNVYLDYLLVIPADLYNDMNLQEEDFDRTGEFITTCGNDNFNIDTSKEGRTILLFVSINISFYIPQDFAVIPCFPSPLPTMSAHCHANVITTDPGVLNVRNLADNVIANLISLAANVRLAKLVITASRTVNHVIAPRLPIVNHPLVAVFAPRT